MRPAFTLTRPLGRSTGRRRRGRDERPLKFGLILPPRALTVRLAAPTHTAQRTPHTAHRVCLSSSLKERAPSSPSESQPSLSQLCLRCRHDQSNEQLFWSEGVGGCIRAGSRLAQLDVTDIRAFTMAEMPAYPQQKPSANTILAQSPAVTAANTICAGLQ